LSIVEGWKAPLENLNKIYENLWQMTKLFVYCSCYTSSARVLPTSLFIEVGYVNQISANSER